MLSSLLPAHNRHEAVLASIFEELRPLLASLEGNPRHAAATLALETPPLATVSPTETERKPAKVIEIFISSVEDDEKLMEELREHLRVMQRQYREREGYRVKIWHSGEILPGQDWKRNVEENLLQAHIILLLVSVKFLNSEFCRSIQIQPALDRHNANRACVIPVILRPCDWKHEIFGHLQPLPAHGKPVIKWKPREDAYLNIITGIRKAIDHLLHPV